MGPNSRGVRGGLGGLQLSLGATLEIIGFGMMVSHASVYQGSCMPSLLQISRRRIRFVSESLSSR